MKPIYTCKACGFISTLRNEFRIVHGVMFDYQCAEMAQEGREPYLTWVSEKLGPAGRRALEDGK